MDFNLLFWPIVLILIGLTSFVPSIVEWEFKIQNSFQGIKAKPTKKTYAIYKAFGIFLIVVGILMLLFSSSL